MVITLLTADAQNNIADSEDCDTWATTYGSSHPILADEPGFSVHAMNEGGAGFPYYMLVDRGMVVNSIVGGGNGEITEEDIVSLL